MIFGFGIIELVYMQIFSHIGLQEGIVLGQYISWGHNGPPHVFSKSWKKFSENHRTAPPMGWIWLLLGLKHVRRYFRKSHGRLERLHSSFSNAGCSKKVGAIMAPPPRWVGLSDTIRSKNFNYKKNVKGH